MTWKAELYSSVLTGSGWVVRGTTMVPYLPWIALAQSTDWINMDCNQLSMGLGWSHHIHTTKGQEEQVCTWGAGNLLVLSATAVAELAVITDSDTAKSWRSGARLQQLSAAAALATAHCGSPCTVNTASSHSYGGSGEAQSRGGPRGDGDERALPLESTFCPWPGTWALLSCWAYFCLPWNF